MDLIVTFLTGRRPVLAERTLLALDEHAPGLLDAATLEVLHNGGDPETAEALEPWRDRVDVWHTTGELLRIGPAVSLLAARVARSGCDRWLHLEDDWEALGRSDDWLERADAALRENPGLASVRLRDDRERVLDRHLTERHRLVWQERDGYRLSPDAHASHNPSLWRGEVATVGWPERDERDLVRRLRSAGWASGAQVVPGEFRHLGVREDGLSLKWSLPDARRQ